MAREFDGANDNVSFGDIPAISDAATITCSAWVWNDNVTQDHFIVGNHDGTSGFTFTTDDVGSATGNTDCYKLFVDETIGTFNHFETATNSAIANTWQHVLFTFTASSEVQMWIDGVEDASSPFATTAADFGNANGSIIMGESNSASQDRNGRLEWVTFWNVVLSDNEIIALSRGVNPLRIRPASLIFCAPLWGSHSTEIELSGGGYTGTVTGATRSASGAPVELLSLGSFLEEIIIFPPVPSKRRLQNIEYATYIRM